MQFTMAIYEVPILCLLLVLQFPLIQACPDGCVCTSNGGKEAVCNGYVNLTQPFPPNVNTVSMTGFHLLVLPKGAFSFVNKVIFRFGNVGVIENGGFENLGYENNRDHCTIEFENVTLTNISSGAFSGACLYSKAGPLKMVGVTIAHLAQDAFSNCTFDVIQIKQANIPDAHTRAFGHDLTVKEIKLEQVDINDIPSYFFAGLSSTEPHVLEISHAYVRFVEPYAFSGINNAKVTIKMSNISKIMTDAFSGAENITSIYIHKSEIGEIEPRVFGSVTSDGTPSSFIHVIANSIHTIRKLSFEGLSTFSTLNVKNNEVGCLEPGAFDNVKSKNPSIENNVVHDTCGATALIMSYTLAGVMCCIAAILK